MDPNNIFKLLAQVDMHALPSPYSHDFDARLREACTKACAAATPAEPSEPELPEPHDDFPRLMGTGIGIALARNEANKRFNTVIEGWRRVENVIVSGAADLGAVARRSPIPSLAAQAQLSQDYGALTDWLYEKDSNTTEDDFGAAITLVRTAYAQTCTALTELGELRGESALTCIQRAGENLLDAKSLALVGLRGSEQ